MKKTLLQVTAFGLVAVLGGTTWAHVRRQKRDSLARDLMVEISRLSDPLGSGLEAEAAFDPAYLDELLQRVSTRVIVMKDSAARAVAQRIDDAWGFWDYDEEAVYTAFRSLRDQVQVSQVARAYLGLGGAGLLDTLRDRLDESEVSTVLSIVRSLPPYRTLQS